MMKTLAEMVVRIRRLVQDTGSNEFAPGVVEGTMEEACDRFARDLVQTTGRRLLRKIGSATELVADQEEYDLPVDLLQVESVEYRARDDDERWLPIGFRDPKTPGQAMARWGTAEILEAPGLAFAGLYWFDDTDTDKVRVWPALKNVIEQKFRVRYYHTIFAPAEDDGTLNDPANAGTDIYLLPDLAASAVEYLTASLLSHEDLEDPKPIMAYHRNYGAIVRQLAGTGNRLRPKRQYIKTGRI